LAVRVIGIDGCRGGWVGLLLDRETSAVTGPTIASLVEAVDPVEAVTIDIPIGLPRAGARAADRLAQSLLGSRRSTVFTTPVRAALEAATLAEALVVARQETGTGLSAQAFALRSRVLEVDAWVRDAGVDVREVHPEVSFLVMEGKPLTDGAPNCERQCHFLSDAARGSGRVARRHLGLSPDRRGAEVRSRAYPRSWVV
jgi:predicted RNase H-like nuclease